MNTTCRIPTPLSIHTETVKPQWIDHNGHMNSAFYVLAFDEAGTSLFNYFGITNNYRKKEKNGIFVGDYHIHYAREVIEGDPLKFTHLIINCDEKKVHYWQEMFHATDGYLAAQCEAIMLHVDLDTRKVSPFPEEVFTRIKSVHEVHTKSPHPENLGRIIRINRKRNLLGN